MNSFIYIHKQDSGCKRVKGGPIADLKGRQSRSNQNAIEKPIYAYIESSYDDENKLIKILLTTIT